MNEPAVDVVILTWNDLDDARAAIDSVRTSRGVEARVYLVDNGSDPPFEPVDDPLLWVHRLDENRGVGGGRNVGAALGEADFICFLDSDARLDPEALQEMCEEMADEKVGLVAPVFSNQSPEIGAGRAPSVARKIMRGAGITDRYAPCPRRPADKAWDIEFAIGACQLVRRRAFLEVGGFDDADLFGPEDVDFCIRLGRAHWRLRQTAGALCHHVARRGSRKVLSRTGLAHLRALVRHYRKHSRAGRSS